MQVALNDIGRDLGLSIQLGSIKYDPYSFRFKGETKVIGDPAAIDNPEAQAKIDWDRNCSMYGLTPQDYGKTITLYNGRQYQLKGFKSGRTKYPVLAVRGGRKFKLSLSHVTRALTNLRNATHLGMQQQPCTTSQPYTTSQQEPR